MPPQPVVETSMSAVPTGLPRGPVSLQAARQGFAGPLALTLLVLVTTPLWIKEIGLYQYIAVEIVIWALFALSYNLLLGQAGLPSFGHGAFFGVGAYAFGLAVKHVAPDLWLGLGAALAAAALAGALVAAFISHRRGIYYALMTIAFGQVLWFVAIKWHSVTGGEDGLLGIPRPPVDLGIIELSLNSNEALFYFAVVLFTLVIAFLWQLQDTPFGRVMAAVKGNEERARYCGHAVWRIKFTSFVLSAALAGLAGALFAMAQNSAYPNVMSLHNSGFVVMMVLIGGGLVSFWGPVIGAAFFILARDLLGATTEAWLLWYGLLFMAVVLFKPEGIVGAWRMLRQRAMRASAGSH
ncbi:MAG TPA: branched-chain amino acid ABC transporter permease [Burkholderiaceae bacterium]|nr:branched-chain amino acid ABC transporter permease [Burkholderiaceae bacterium]